MMSAHFLARGNPSLRVSPWHLETMRAALMTSRHPLSFNQRNLCTFCRSLSSSSILSSQKASSPSFLPLQSPFLSSFLPSNSLSSCSDPNSRQQFLGKNSFEPSFPKWDNLPRSHFSSSSWLRDSKDDKDPPPPPPPPSIPPSSKLSRSGGVVPVDPVQEMSRLLSLPFPEEVFIFPVWGKPLLPMVIKQEMFVHNPFLERLFTDSVDQHDGRVGVFFVEDPTTPGPIVTLDKIKPVGVLGGIVNARLIRDSDGTKKYMLFLIGLKRVEIVGLGERHENGLQTVKIKPLEDTPYDKSDVQIRALVGTVLHHVNELFQNQMNPLPRNILENYVRQLNPDNPAELADLAVIFSFSPRDDIQRVIEELDVRKRLSLVVYLLRKALDVTWCETKMSKELDEKVSTQHRRATMMEQLKILKKELGLDKDEKEALLAKYRERLESLQLTDGVQKVVTDELNKLSMLEPASSEYNVTRTYLDWLTVLPWGVHSKDNLELDHAKKVLESAHYSLEDIKTLILEFIAVGKLKGEVSGKIFCFVGPPGVGKTSIGMSIANALDRKFFRFSVGGLNDVAEIKGHRRTYVGAMPGKLIQCLKTVATSNPVIMIDEIDKMQRGYQGDPASALLEVLDPEQNNSFGDHYLDVPYDLSKVLFLCTANVVDTIPPPLKDRMEIVRLSGYVMEEKLQIAKRFLIPSAMEEMGLKKSQVTLHLNAVKQLIHKYCRESGVRNLQKHIEKVLRKAAYRLVSEPDLKKVVITEKNLSDFVGKPIFTSDRYYEKPPPGVTMGLSWTAMGGATLYIETVVEPSASKGEGLRITGQMGGVMKESTEIAYTYAKTFLQSLNLTPQKHKTKLPVPEPAFFSTNTIHLHVPEGATPKDGPSAGITMVTSLLSLATNRPVNPDVAMTGELTVTGKVLPIGGVKEKTIAAKRSKVKHVIFPIANQKDFEELPEYIREGLTVHYVSYYNDAFDVVFGDAIKVKEKELKKEKEKQKVEQKKKEGEKEKEKEEEEGEEEEKEEEEEE